MRVFEKIGELMIGLKRITNPSYYDSVVKNVEGLISKHFPHGSGFDSKPEFSFDLSAYNKWIIFQSYHHMNDNGYYCGWSHFKIIVTPCFVGGFEIKIIAKHSSRECSKRFNNDDYFYEVYYECLNKFIDI